MISASRLLLGLALCLASLATSPAEPVRFIPATPENTRLADGSPLPDKLVSIGWKWLPDQGNKGVFESTGDPAKNASPVIIIATSLDPGRDYEVFGFFWTHGFGAPPADRAREPHHWPARFGLGLADLTTFGGREQSAIPWIICPESTVGKLAGHVAVLEEKDPLIENLTGWRTAKDDLRLIRARVGISRVGKDGTLPVFIDDFPDSKFCGRTRIDGIGIRPAPEGAAPTAGVGDSKALHLALRAGDKLGAARELAAGADANSLDANGLSPLFHPACTGDQDMSKMLLAAGADPNVMGQTVLALTAAASTGDAAMVRLLLDGGAEVPAAKLEPAPWMQKGARIDQVLQNKPDQSWLHPAIAAIRIGSLASLKELLEKRPDLDLQALGPVLDGASQEATSQFLVEDAMAMGHDELASFLIDRGCRLSSMAFHSRGRREDVDLLVRSVTQGKSMARSMEALLRRGVPATVPGHPPTDEGIVPWDGLSAAVSVSDLELTKRFLALVPPADARKWRSLIPLAMWAGDHEIIRLLGETFPDAVSEWNQQVPETKIATWKEALRLLLPRTKPLPAGKGDSAGEWTVAVIPAPNEGGQSALLEVAASNEPGWKVVDRQEIQTALGEARFGNPWGKGEHRFADLGDRISADLLILVSRLEGEGLQLLRFEAVDVVTGLPVLREHMEKNAFESEAAAAPLLGRIRAAFAKARAGERPKAITMLPFSVGKTVPDAAGLSRLFSAAIHSELDATPGILTVGMDQIQTIANEQKLAGGDGLWAAAFTLEGGVAALEDGKVSLTLRLRPLYGGHETVTDVTESDPAGEIAAMAARAWKKLASADPLAAEAISSAKPDERQAKAEAARLVREGEWLVNSGVPAEALPLFERAELLGADPEQLVPAHLGALVRFIKQRDRELFSPMRTYMPQGIQVRACPELLFYRTLLDQAAYYLSRYGAASFKWKAIKSRDSRDIESGNFLHVVSLLSCFRASLPKVPPACASVEEMRAFGEDLDSLTADYFHLRSAMAPETFDCRPGTAAMLRRNPEFLKGCVTMLFITTANAQAGIPMFSEILGDRGSGISPWYGQSQLIMDEISWRMGEYRRPNRSFREAEIAFLRATGDQRGPAARRYAEEFSKLGRRDGHTRRMWLGGSFLKRYGPAALTDRGYSFAPRNDEVLLAAQVHDPIGSMDWIGHDRYDYAIRALVRLEEESPAGATKYLKVYNPWGKFDGLAKAASREPAGWQGVERVLGGVKLWESIYGRPLYESLSKRWETLYQPKPGNGGGQEALAARLLVDLRSIDHSHTGMFRLPTIDISRADRLWIYFQPFEEKTTTLDDGGQSSVPRNPWRPPWLLGIDCIGGKISTAVNLSRAPGFDSGATNPRASGFDSGDGFIVQTDEMILTNAKWVGSGEKKLIRENSVLIRKDDGQMVPLDPPSVISSAPDMIQSRSESVGAVALGGEFFGLRQAGDLKARYYTNLKMPLEIVRITPAGKVSPVTSFGRRPQLTPFDPIDRFPRMLLRDGNRVLVIHDSMHVGYFDPKDNSWEMDANENEKRMTRGRSLTENEFRSHIFPHSRINVGNGGPAPVIHSESTFPDMLLLVKPGGSEQRIKLRLEVPDGFSKQLVFGDRLWSNGRTGTLTGYGTYESRKNTDAYNIVVLNQTKDDLILALQVGKGVKWLSGKRIGAFLPLLWAIPKAEIISAAGMSAEALPNNTRK